MSGQARAAQETGLRQAKFGAVILTLHMMGHVHGMVASLSHCLFHRASGIRHRRNMHVLAEVYVLLE